MLIRPRLLHPKIVKSGSWVSAKCSDSVAALITRAVLRPVQKKDRCPIALGCLCHLLLYKPCNQPGHLREARACLGLWVQRGESPKRTGSIDSRGWAWLAQEARSPTRLH